MCALYFWLFSVNFDSSGFYSSVVVATSVSAVVPSMHKYILLMQFCYLYFAVVVTRFAFKHLFCMLCKVATYSEI